VEDGREIFDDDLDEESIAKQSKDKGGRKRKSKNQDDSENSKGSGNIRHMLANMQPKKKKTEDINIDNDEVLGELMKDLDAKPLASAPLKPVQKPKPQRVQNMAPPPVQTTRIAQEKHIETVRIKKEPEMPASQFIEDPDSMDCFSEQDFAEVF